MKYKFHPRNNERKRKDEYDKLKETLVTFGLTFQIGNLIPTVTFIAIYKKGKNKPYKNAYKNKNAHNKNAHFIKFYIQTRLRTYKKWLLMTVNADVQEVMAYRKHEFVQS